MSKKSAQSARAKKRSAETFKENLSLLSDAGLRIFMVPTREQFRLQSAIYDWCTEEQKPLRVWSAVSGWGFYPNRWASISQTTRDPITATRFIDGTHGIDRAFKGLYDSGDPSVQLTQSVNAHPSFGGSTLAGVEAEYPNGGVFVMLNPQDTLEKPLIQQFIRHQSYRSLSTEQILIMVVPEGVSPPSEIEDQIRMLEFSTPTFDDLRSAYDLLLSGVADSSGAVPSFSEDDITHLIENAAGMGQSEFEHAIGIAFVKHGRTLIDDPKDVSVDAFIEEIHAQKIEIVRKTDLLELLEDIDMDDVGGLDLAKEWLHRRKVAFRPDAKQLGLDQPRGVLLVGPPGTGKSLWARSCASILTYPCIKFDVGRVFAKYVGDSEERMRRALKLVEAMAPCVLLVDELDKAFAGGGSDGGTSSRVFGTFLTWLQERDKFNAPVFVVMTANNVHGLPPELMRRGRIDEIFAVNFPCMQERADIIGIHLRKRGKRLPTPHLERVALETGKFIGSELEAAVKEGFLTAAVDETEITADIIIQEARKIVPIAVAWKEKITAMQEWAKYNARPSSSVSDDINTGQPVDADGKPVPRGINIKARPRNGKLKGSSDN